MVQRVTNRYSSHDSVSAMLSNLGWHSLEYHHYDSRLAMFYKIEYGLVAVSMPSYFERPRKITCHTPQSCLWAKLGRVVLDPSSCFSDTDSEIYSVCDVCISIVPILYKYVEKHILCKTATDILQWFEIQTTFSQRFCIIAKIYDIFHPSKKPRLFLLYIQTVYLRSILKIYGIK